MLSVRLDDVQDEGGLFYWRMDDSFNKKCQYEVPVKCRASQKFMS